MACTKHLFPIIGIICYIAHFRSVLSFPHHDEVLTHHEDEVERNCMMQYKVDDSIFVNPGDEDEGFDITLKDESNEDHRCFVQCLLEGYQFMRNGKLDIMYVMEMIMRELEEEDVDIEPKLLHAHISSCAARVGEGKCNTAYLIIKCLSGVSSEERRKK
ncbi:uncharacterized protein [Periplaneta americana]|uniref:uncharacterized protein n=1 Tax=Periplaneta americana TaxID=6978 RepID=UPI0037E8DA64